ACDLIVASRAATFALPEVKRGLIAGGGGLVRLPRKIPINVAMQMALTGMPMSAERAYELGFINLLCEQGSALDTALALAGQIKANAPLALQHSKQLIRDCESLPLRVAFDRQRKTVQAVAASADAREGSLAFLEKREPK